MIASKSSGFSLLETVAVSAFLAVSTMGLGSALISGTALTEKAHRRMSQVATAENIMEQIRQVSDGDLSGVVTGYDGVATAAHSSIGFTNDPKRSLTVRVPLAEGSVPGSIDLNANGEVDPNVDPEDARILVVDIEGAGKLRLRTAVVDIGRLQGITFNREGNPAERPVAFGETYDEDGRTLTPPTVPTNVTSTVSTVSNGLNSGENGAEVVLLNEGTGNRTIATITIIPDQANLYFKNIKLNGDNIFESDDLEVEVPGTVTINIESSLYAAPGESTLTVNEFYYMDEGGSAVAVTPGQVALTITFDDGSIVTTVVN